MSEENRNLSRLDILDLVDELLYMQAGGKEASADGAYYARREGLWVEPTLKERCRIAVRIAAGLQLSQILSWISGPVLHWRGQLCLMLRGPFRELV